MKYRNLYETSPEMYRTIDEKGHIVDANVSYSNALGYSKEKIGKSIFEHTTEKSLKEIHESFFTWKDKDIVQNKEIRLKRKDGTVFPALLSASSIYDKDGKKLEVVFVNLILNAIQAMEKNGIINIRLAESQDKIIIEIEDTGHGIPEDILPKIFEPLFTT